MIDYFTEDRSAEQVNGRIGPATSPRLARVMTSLVNHLHAFIKDVELTEEEWATAISFLTRSGQICSDTRQEFILLSDILGVSMLVDAINHRQPEGATETTVFGPFHVEGAPERQMGDSISLDGKGETCLFEGRVLDLDGNPVEGALIDVWSDNEDGFYDVQQPGVQPPSTTAASSARAQTGAMRSGAYVRSLTRSPTTVRPVSCSRFLAGTPGGPPICTSWSRHRVTGG